jgi:hypothetical protein
MHNQRDDQGGNLCIAWQKRYPFTVSLLSLIMNEPSPSDQEDFQQELEALRQLLQKNLQKLKQDPFLGTQVEFWMESAKFMETNIEIWEEAGNAYKHQQAMERMRKVLDILQQLIEQLNGQSGEEES